jgi:hypothetical protein
MNQCWNWDPQQRPSFSQIVQTLRNVKQNRWIPIPIKYCEKSKSTFSLHEFLFVVLWLQRIIYPIN